MVQRQLNKHPNIYFTGALFSIKGWGGNGVGLRRMRTGLDDRWNDLDYRVEHHRELLEHIYTVHRRWPTPRRWLANVLCTGFKHHLSGAKEVTDTLLADPALTKIVLMRSNILACYSSDKVAKLKQRELAGETVPAQVRFDADEFADYLRIRRGVYDRWMARFSISAGEFRIMDYATARTPRGADDMVRFIGLELQPIRQMTKKRNSDNVPSRFENVDETLAYLETNGLTEWVEET
jgi:hypothetical protein